MAYKIPQAVEEALTRHYNIYPNARVYKIEAEIVRKSEFAVLVYSAYFSVPLRYDITLQ